MKYLVYISTAKKLFSEEELVDLLLIARKNNEQHNVTGLLLYGEGTFIQALEGEEADVDKIFKTIEADLRHKNIIRLITGNSGARVFPGWSMAFASVHTEVLKQITGYLDPADKSTVTNDHHAMVTMLKTFAETNKIPLSF